MKAELSRPPLSGACIEKLLLQCATALETNDVNLAHQIMWVLNNVASPHGDSNQRLTSWFLTALLTRAATLSPTNIPFRRPMTVIELANYVDLTPWHRFGFCASNAAILKAVRGRPRVHILDFGIFHCMQWPTLIDALAKLPDGPPALRITVPSARPPVPPSLTVSVEEIGHRLSNFAMSRHVPLEFHVATSFDPSILAIRADETLVVNCQSWLRYLPDEPADRSPSSRDGFLEAIRGLNPRVVTVTDEDSDLDSPSLASRIMACFTYVSIHFDALETFAGKDNRRRAEYEADVGRKIENVVVCDGAERIERAESGARLAERMRRVGFDGVAFEEEAVREVELLLVEHASGWGMKREEDMLVLTWKGHSSVFTTAWFPSGLDGKKDLSFSSRTN